MFKYTFQDFQVSPNHTICSANENHPNTQSAALYARLAKYRARVYLQNCKATYPGGRWFADVVRVK